MAIGYARTENVNRANRSNKRSGSAVAAAAYAIRAKATDENTGASFDYRRHAKAGEEIIPMPIVVPEGQPMIERFALWNKAERAEKQRNSTTARLMIGALPNELDAEAQKRICRKVAEFIAKQHGVAVDAVIHRDDGNNHVHFQYTTRRYRDGELHEKTRELDLKATASKSLRSIRQCWQDECNNELQAAGFSERIDMRSYDARGIDRNGQEHLGKDAWHHEQRNPGENEKAARNKERVQRTKDKERFKEVCAELRNEAGECKRLKKEIEQRQASIEAMEAKAKKLAQAELAAERAALVQQQKPAPPPARSAPARMVEGASIFTTPEDNSKRLYKAIRHLLSDLPLRQATVDRFCTDVSFITKGGAPVNLNYMDELGVAFTHYSTAIGEENYKARGPMEAQAKRVVGVMGVIEKKFEADGGKIDRKMMSGAGQRAMQIRQEGLKFVKPPALENKTPGSENKKQEPPPKLAALSSAERGKRMMIGMGHMLDKPAIGESELKQLTQFVGAFASDSTFIDMRVEHNGRSVLELYQEVRKKAREKVGEELLRKLDEEVRNVIKATAARDVHEATATTRPTLPPTAKSGFASPRIWRPVQLQKQRIEFKKPKKMRKLPKYDKRGNLKQALRLDQTIVGQPQESTTASVAGTLQPVTNLQSDMLDLSAKLAGKSSSGSSNTSNGRYAISANMTEKDRRNAEEHNARIAAQEEFNRKLGKKDNF